MNRWSDMDALPIIAAQLIPHVDAARSHPRLPSFDAGDAERWQDWLQDQQLEVMQVWMEDDAQAVDIYRKFLHGDTAWALSAWQPCAPNGENAWFLLAVFDGREGPCAYFVRTLAHRSGTGE